MYPWASVTYLNKYMTTLISQNFKIPNLQLQKIGIEMTQLKNESKYLFFGEWCDIHVKKTTKEHSDENATKEHSDENATPHSYKEQL